MSKRFWTVLLVFVLALAIPLGALWVWKRYKVMQEMQIFPPEIYAEEESGEKIFIANGTPIVIDAPNVDAQCWTLQEELQAQLGNFGEVGALVHWPKRYGSKEEWYVGVPKDITIVGGAERRSVTIRTQIDMRGGTVGTLLGGCLHFSTSQSGVHIDISGGTVLHEISLIGLDSIYAGPSRLRVTGGQIGLPGGEAAIVRLCRESTEPPSNNARQKMRYDLYGGEWNAIVNCDEVYLVHASGKPVFDENGVLILYDGTGITVQQELDPGARIRVTAAIKATGVMVYDKKDIEAGRKIASPRLYRRDIIPAAENYEALQLDTNFSVFRFDDISEFVPLESNKTLGMLRDNAVRVLYASQLVYEDGKLTVRYTDDEDKVHELPDQPYQTTYRNSKGEISSVRPKKGAYTQIITYEGDRLEWIAPGTVEIEMK